MPTKTPSTTELKRAAKLEERIQKLQEELSSILASEVPEPAKKRGRPPGAKKKAKWIMSAAHKEAIAAAQRKRWAKASGASVKAAPAKRKKKGGMSAEGRARVAAAQKARWAAFKRSKKG